MTTEQRNDLLMIMSDMHKDAYGFRPRHINYSAMTDAELEAEVDKYQAEIKQSLNEEKIQLEADIKAFNELMQKTIDMGAGDRTTALRWIVQGANDWDSEAIVWSMGILFSNEGRELVKEINETCEDILAEYFNK